MGGKTNPAVPLDDLDRVPWSELRTAHGTAEGVPVAIRGLAAADSTTVDDWYWQLDNHVVLQGSVYEAAYHVIPFLLRIIDSELSSDVRAAAYDVLIEIARGVPGDITHATITDDSDSVDLVTACKRRIDGRLERFRADLLGSDGDVRRKALDLLVSMDTPPPELLAFLESVQPGDDRELAELLDREIADLKEQ